MTKKKIIGTAAAILATSAVMARVMKNKRNGNRTRANQGGATYSRAAGGTSRRSKKARRATSR